ncbi:glycosyltransferase family 2 protein, partial [Methylophilaceae bacterium]|nr:glycosyltransferase family 2 protein [Methylophilaceae bacterium]
MKTNKTNPIISVIFSFFNEENNIPELIKRTKTHLNSLVDEKKIKNYEIIFVNDASTDKSEILINKEIDRDDKIKLINMSRNFGNSECVLAGMKESIGDVIVYMDCDLQDPPELIGDMVRAWKSDKKTEVVFTTRSKREGESFLKLLITKFGYRFIRKISDIDIPVDSGDFKLLSRRVVDELLKLTESKPYVRGLISYIGFKQTQLFYERKARHDGSENTKYPVLTKRVLYGYLDRAMISFSDAPLKLIFFLGLILLFFSVIFIFYVIIAKFSGTLIPGWAAIMVSVVFFGSLNILLLGVVGLYIGSIFTESKKRPL